jgi:hypothetical protein
MSENINYPGVVTQLQLENEALRMHNLHLSEKLKDASTPFFRFDLNWFRKLSSVDKLYLLMGVCVVAYTMVFIMQAFTRMI